MSNNASEELRERLLVAQADRLVAVTEADAEAEAAADVKTGGA